MNEYIRGAIKNMRLFLLRMNGTLPVMSMLQLQAMTLVSKDSKSHCLTPELHVFLWHWYVYISDFLAPVCRNLQGSLSAGPRRPKLHVEDCHRCQELCYHPEAKQQSSQSSCVVVVFFDICRVVHCDFVTQGQTVNTKYYCDILTCLRELQCNGKRALEHDKL